MEDKMIQPAQAMPVSSFMSSEIGELAAALAAAQGEFTFAAKDSVADMGTKGGRRKYADLQSVLEAVRDGLAKNGLAVIQAPMPNASGITLRTTLAHKSGQWIASELTLPNDRMGGIQGMGSALTYARRYALAAMVGVAQDDDDGEGAMSASKAAEKERVQQTRQQAKASNPDPMTKAQHSAVMAYLTRRHGNDRQGYIDELSAFFGRTITSSAELTKSMASDFIDAINYTQQEA